MHRPPNPPESQRDVLAALAIFDARARAQGLPHVWARPMDVGGVDGSHHAVTLRALLKKGFVARRLRGSLLNEIRGTALYARLVGQHRSRSMPRGSYEYQITEAGLAIVEVP